MYFGAWSKGKYKNNRIQILLLMYGHVEVYDQMIKCSIKNYVNQCYIKNFIEFYLNLQSFVELLFPSYY
ncbi:hypothetical protein BpHYR1_008237 [Brachionus plicatilis]|uniref:Uncharacterized protein n=1 Tax=Brachionus plicatilis TaxID=10195 RepID=A0A3M7QKW5_BRAPC|nr:hypothetical protein BpHYR1_008237 [Brachionus plicatilis]